jgi:hypothetical protein
MKLRELAETADLFVLTPMPDGEEELTHGYTSDLLSNILAHIQPGSVLVTTQLHQDVVAVAALAGIRAVIFSCGCRPDEELLRRATEEKLTLFTAEADSFEVVGQLYESGLHGTRGAREVRPSPRGHRRRVRADAAGRESPALQVATGG